MPAAREPRFFKGFKTHSIESTRHRLPTTERRHRNGRRRRGVGQQISLEWVREYMASATKDEKSYSSRSAKAAHNPAGSTA